MANVALSWFAEQKRGLTYRDLVSSLYPELKTSDFYTCSLQPYLTLTHMTSPEIITDFINDGHGAGSEKQCQCGINA